MLCSAGPLSWLDGVSPHLKKDRLVGGLFGDRCVESIGLLPRRCLRGTSDCRKEFEDVLLVEVPLP